MRNASPVRLGGYGIRLRSGRSAGGLPLAYRTWDSSETTGVILRKRRLNVPDVIQTRVAAETEGPTAGKPRPVAPVLSGGSQMVRRLGGDWLYPGLAVDAGQSGTARGIWRETQQYLRLYLLGPGSRRGSSRRRSGNRADIRRSDGGHYGLARLIGGYPGHAGPGRTSRNVWRWCRAGCWIARGWYGWRSLFRGTRSLHCRGLLLDECAVSLAA